LRQQRRRTPSPHPLAFRKSPEIRALGAPIKYTGATTNAWEPVVVLPAAEYRQSKTQVGRRAPLIAPLSPSPGHPKAVASLPRLVLLVPGWARLLALVLISLLAASSLDAAHPDSPGTDNPLSEPRFTSVGVGIIPRYVVPTIAQDRAGFLWIATGDGLVRFDGYRFRPQERDSPDPTARNLGWIRALLAGRDGRLWVGTEWDGLAVYDPASESLTACRHHHDRVGGVMPTIRALVEDAAGGIWVGSEGGGLDRFDPGSGNFSHYRHSGQPGSLPDNRVQALLIDRQGTLWVGTWAGLSRHQAGSDHFEPIFSAPGAAGNRLAGRTVQALFEASDGRIWVGTQQGDLAIIDPATSEGLLIHDAPDSVSPGGVSSFVEAPGGLMWVGRSSGIEIRDLRDGRLRQRLQHDPRKPAGLAGNEVTSLTLDHAGLIWVGGFGVGLQRHDPSNRSIWLRGADAQPDSPFSAPDVRSLLHLDNGEVWAATHQGGIAVMDGQLRVTGTVQPRGAGQEQPAARAPGQPLPAVRVEAMAQAGDGTIWLGADSELHQFSRSRRQLRTLPHAGGATRRLLASSDGSLWVATQDGVFRLLPGTAAVARLSQPGGQPLHADINALAEAADGSVWIGSGKGLFRVTAGGSELQPVAEQPGARLGNPSVIGLLFDRQQTCGWTPQSPACIACGTGMAGGQASSESASAMASSIDHLAATCWKIDAAASGRRCTSMIRRATGSTN
jgi:ligand-binding sensor domain-containing protein